MATTKTKLVLQPRSAMDFAWMKQITQLVNALRSGQITGGNVHYSDSNTVWEIPIATSNGSFRYRGAYYADSLNIAPGNIFKAGDIVRMDDNPDGYTPAAPWGSNSIGGRITATAGASDVSFKLTPYEGVATESENNVLNLGWQYTILCVKDVTYSAGKFIQLFVSDTGVPGVLSRAQVTSGPGGGPNPVDDSWVVLGIDSIFLKIEEP